MKMKSFNFTMEKENGHKIYTNNHTLEYDLDEALRTVYRLALGCLQDDQVQLRKLNRVTDVYEDYFFDSDDNYLELIVQEAEYGAVYFSIWKNEKMLISFSIRQD